VRATATDLASRSTTLRAPQELVSARPFLKWVGGKRQLFPHIQPLLPQTLAGRYVEPFVGGGAVFWNYAPGAAVLADWNQELVNCWTVVRDQVDALMECLKTHVYEKDYYYEVRSVHWESLGPIEAAARTIFLNKTGFNGLYRVNSKGLFNVPFGRYTRPTICDETNLPACSQRLQNVEIKQADFEASLAGLGAGDVAYVDPPYVPANATSNFTSYTASGFGPQEQQRLSRALLKLHRRGGRFVLSNADAPATWVLYAELFAEDGVSVEQVQARRSVNSKAGRRGRVGEILAHNTPG